MPTYDPNIQAILDNHPDAHAFVTCHGDCGLQSISEEQYDEQIDDVSTGWTCPTCQGPADYNDELSEIAQNRDEDDGEDDEDEEEEEDEDIFGSDFGYADDED